VNSVPSPKPLILDLAVSDAVAQIADRQLKHAAKALARMRDPGDRTALHNFRVAIRRLRSLLDAYRPWIGRAGGKKSRRRLRALTRMTGLSRDAEVQIAWLEKQRRDRKLGDHAGVDWLLRQVRTRKRNNDRTARNQLGEDFEALAKSLRKRLGAVEDAEPSSFRAAFSDRLEVQADRFFGRLAGIAKADDYKLIHKSRIEAKRLRYVVEPMRGILPEARAVVREMKRLQDLLGRLHDNHVLEAALQAAGEEVASEKARRLHAAAIAGDNAALAREHRKDEQLGLAELAIRAHRERDALFAPLDRQWIRTRTLELTTLVRNLRAVCLPGNFVEIERKFLLKSLPPTARSAAANEIEQGWLPGERLRERLRRVKSGDGEKYLRTIKLGAGIQRMELEEETTAELFRALWPLTEGCRVHKRRYRMEEGALTWEIDQFLDRDLVLAEVELPDVGTAVELPKWLERFVVREVTEDPAFLNLKLAR
jgi:CHAD domain-containing protein/CYTH domain-containing protein